MQTLTATQLTHLKRGGYIGYSITCYPLQGASFTITEENIIEDSLTLERGSWSTSNALQIGNADAAELIFTLDNSEEQWDAINLKGANLWFDWDIDGEPLAGGGFIIDRVERGYDSVKVFALDFMVTFDKEYDGGLAFPATLQQILQYCSNKSWCDLHSSISSGFLNSDYVVDKAPEVRGLTYWQLVKWVAQLAGGNAWVDSHGDLRISWFGDDASELDLDDDMMTQWVIYDEAPVTVTGVQYVDTNENYTAGSTELPVSFTGNELLQKDHQAIINAINNKVSGTTFLPVSYLPTVFLPNVWPGDTLSITSLGQSVLVSKHHMSTLSDMGCGGERELIPLSNLSSAERTEIKHIVDNSVLHRLQIDTYINPGKIEFGAPEVLKQTYYDDPYQLNAIYTYNVIALDSERALLYYMDYLGYHFMRVVSVVNGVMSYGNEYAFTTPSARQLYPAVISSDRFVVLVRDTDALHMALFTITGNTIAKINTTALYDSDPYTIDSTAVCRVRSDLVLVKFNRNYSTDPDLGVYFITVGIEANGALVLGNTKKAVGWYAAELTPLADNLVFVTINYGVYGTYQMGMGFVIQFTGVSHNYSEYPAQEFVLSEDQYINTSTTRIGPDRVLIAYATPSGIHARIATISPTNYVTFGTTFSQSTTPAGNIRARALTADRVLIAYDIESAVYSGYMQLLTIEGNDISGTTPYMYVSDTLDDYWSTFSFDVLSDKKAVLTYANGKINAHIRTVDIDTHGDHVEISGSKDGLGIVIEGEQIFGFTSDDIYMRSPGADNHRLGCDSTGPYYMKNGVKTYL